MAICPICKNEYREGIKMCADCKVPLVEKTAESSKLSVLSGEKSQVEEIKAYLEYCKVKNVTIHEDDQTGQCQLMIQPEDLKSVRSYLAVYANQKNQEAYNNLSDEEKQAIMNQHKEATEAQRKGVYQSSASKAADNKSSAWTLLMIGGLGIVFAALCLLGVLPFQLTRNVFMLGTMIAIFAIFIIMGFVSLHNSKKFVAEAENENNLTSAIMEYVKENLTPKDIDGRVYVDDQGDEVLYFKRSEIIKAKINEKFMNLDQDYLEQLIDNELYDMIYQDKS